MWKDGECWVLGGSTSVPYQFEVPLEIINPVMAGKLSPETYSPYMEPIHNKHVIGINNAYLIGNWIDILFFGDNAWYLVHRAKLAQHPALKVSCSNRWENIKQEHSDGIKYLPKNKKHPRGLSPDPCSVSCNGNNGAASLSLAVHLGVRRIILLGFDMKMDAGLKYSHWHGSHGNKRPPPFQRHLMGFSDIAKEAKERGVEIINASPDSMITQFPKVSVKELLLYG